MMNETNRNKKEPETKKVRYSKNRRVDAFLHRRATEQKNINKGKKNASSN
jgi:hypothetical protein